MMKDTRDLEKDVEIPSLSYEVTQGKINRQSRWVNYGRDAKNIHTDEETAKRAGLPGTIAQSRLILAGTICESMLNLFGKGWIQGGRLSIAFTRFIRPGDILTSRGIVRDKIAEDSHTRVLLEVWLENQRGERVISGEASGLVR